MLCTRNTTLRAVMVFVRDPEVFAPARVPEGDDRAARIGEAKFIKVIKLARHTLSPALHLTRQGTRTCGLGMVAPADLCLRPSCAKSPESQPSKAIGTLYCCTGISLIVVSPEEVLCTLPALVPL